MDEHRLQEPGGWRTHQVNKAERNRRESVLIFAISTSFSLSHIVSEDYIQICSHVWKRFCNRFLVHRTNPEQIYWWMTGSYSGLPLSSFMAKLLLSLLECEILWFLAGSSLWMICWLMWWSIGRLAASSPPWGSTRKTLEKASTSLTLSEWPPQSLMWPICYTESCKAEIVIQC